MRILVVHARYALRGGEDEVFEAERDLLREHGHIVVEYVQDNRSIRGSRILSAGLRTVWSQGDYKAIRERIRQSASEIVAVHNFFPLISPAVYYAAHAEHVPVVQTLHNYRLICPAATLLRDGKLCEDCVGRPIAWPGVLHACYRGSRVLSAGVAAMTSCHRMIRTWDRKVTRYIALSDFMRDKMIAGGLPAAKVVVKPNFTMDTGTGRGDGNFFVFAGRLSLEKGVSTLLRAWNIAKPSCELHILGSGPEELNLKSQAASSPNVRFLGHQPKARVQEEMGRAIAVIVPSIWHEAFGLTVIEAFAKGTPVIATELGAMSSLVRSGANGFLFARDDAAQLAELLSRRQDLQEMRAGARQAYEERFTPAQNYEWLAELYRAAIADTPTE